MNSKVLLHAFGVVLFAGHACVALAQNPGERKVRIEITRNENGSQSHVTREFDLSDEQQLADALRELGVMDEFNLIGDGENLVIDMKRMRDGGLLNDMSMALSIPEVWAPDCEPQAYLGVFYGNWNEGCEVKDKKNKAPVKEGACITALESGAPAEKAGLKAGDVIVAMDDKKISSGEDLVDAIDDHKPGDEVRITYYRGKEKSTTKVTLGERESEEKTRWNWDWNWERDWDGEHAMGMERLAEIMAEQMNESFLGVEGDDVDGGKGVRLTNVVDSSAAEQMGLKAGDVLRSFNGTDIQDFESLAEMIDETEPGQDVMIVAERDGKEITFSGKIGHQQNVGAWSFGMHGMAPMAPMMPMPPMPPMPKAGQPMSPEDQAAYEREMEEYQQLMEEHARDMAGHNRDMAEHDRDMAGHDHDMADNARNRAEYRRELDELRREMDRLRRDLRGEVTREVRVTVDVVKLTKEESDLLKNKGVAGLDNTLDLGGLNVYPNPSKASFSITFNVPERGDLNVDVHDSNGERVYHETITGFKGPYERVLDMSDRASGNYYLVITQNGKAQARKLLRQ